MLHWKPLVTAFLLITWIVLSVYRYLIAPLGETAALILHSIDVELLGCVGEYY